MATTMLPEGTASQQAHAEVLLSRSHKWAHGYDKVRGVPFVSFASSRIGKDGRPVYYQTRADGQPGCTCEGSRRYPVCSHQLAVRLHAERSRPTRRAYRELLPTCRGCSELVEDGQCYACLSEQTRRQEMAAKRERLANR